MNKLSTFPLLLLSGFLLVNAFGCAGDPNIEGARLDLANRDFDRALENVNTALERDPQNATAYEMKGRILQEKADETASFEEHSRTVEEMLEAYQRAVELSPGLENDVTQRLRLAYYNEFNRGIQAFNRAAQNRDEFEAAAGYFRLATLLQPDSSGAYVNQAFALLNAGRQDEAIAPLETALELGDTQPETFVFLSELYTVSGQVERALEVLTRAAEIHPEDPDIRAQLLNAYVQTGRVDDALNEYRVAVERDPDNPLYRYNLGSLLLEFEDYEGAIEHLSASVQLDPDYANAFYNLGAAYVNLAVDLNEELAMLDDQLRAERENLSAAEIEAREATMERKVAERRELFEAAVQPLERAKTLMDASGDDAMAVCAALFSAYVQTGQQESAQQIAACAGYDDID